MRKSDRPWKFDPYVFFAIAKGISCPECGEARVPARRPACFELRDGPRAARLPEETP